MSGITNIVSYSVLGAAEAAGVSEKSIRNELKAKRLRHARFGNRILITPADLQAWVESRMEREYRPMRVYCPPNKEKAEPQAAA